MEYSIFLRAGESIEDYNRRLSSMGMWCLPIVRTGDHWCKDEKGYMYIYVKDQPEDMNRHAYRTHPEMPEEFNNLLVAQKHDGGEMFAPMFIAA